MASPWSCREFAVATVEAIISLMRPKRQSSVAAKIVNPVKIIQRKSGARSAADRWG
jgi:hypothetical protein